ncbi:MAG TPA: carbonic anhydrase family protein [Thermoanaerobaculia bacterium]|nr:carbonic anhydrase family protein [Thermoanaerobaculia bacterium]
MNSRVSLGAFPVLASALFFSACSSNAPTTSVTPAPPAVQERNWGYVANAETAGPSDWVSLPGNAACAAGKKQSPVDLATRAPFPVEAKDLPNLVFRYGTTKLHLVNKGHTVQADVEKGSTVEIDGAAWALLQLHFHAPSEHSLDGLHYPMEMHLVHAGPDGKPGLVVGVFLVQGGDNPAFTPLLSDLPKVKGARKDDSSVTVDLAKLLPENRAYLAYDGSLTTPPCTEGIRWYVLQSPMGITGEQLGAFVTVPGMNTTNRPVQPLAGRKVLLDTTP